jgi:O-antigen/teichoic acid export membrane protein
VAVWWGGRLMSAVYGSAYAGQGHTLAVLAVALLVSGLGTVADHGLRALGRPDRCFRASLLALAVTLPAATGLMVLWQVPGAAWGYLAGCLAGTLARCLAFARLAGQRPPAKRSG